jgi:hypothetical protein
VSLEILSAAICACKPSHCLISRLSGATGFWGEIPASWLSNLFHVSGQQLSMFACGCEVLLLHGVTPEHIQWTIEQNRQVVVFLVDGHYDKALWIARALVSEAISNAEGIS